MTQAERTRTIKYVLTESRRWLLRRRRNTKKMVFFIIDTSRECSLPLGRPEGFLWFPRRGCML